MKNYKYSIIIPHINEGYLLDIMLDSIYNYVQYENYEIIIIDDGSDNISHLDFTKTHFLKDKITMYFEKELGSPKARNFGAEKSTGDYLIFLDSHMYFRDDFLSKLNELLNKYPEIDLLQPIIGSIKDKNMYGIIYKIKDFNLYSTWDNVKINGQAIKVNEVNDITETPNISGGATIIKKSVFQDLTGFHNHFIKWGCEDLEFSMRAWLSGYKCFFTPKLFAAHYFKDKFTNTVVKTEQVLNNRIMFALTCFFGEKQEIVLNYTKKEFGEEMYNDIYNQILDNNEFFIWRNIQRGKFLYDDELYFKKFRDYLPKFIKNKIAIITQYTDNIENYSKYTLVINKKYAEKHGYDFIIHKGRFNNSDRYITWDKIKLVQDNIGKYDYIVWLDADIMIMNHDIKIEEFITDKEIMICSDNSNSGRIDTFNSGSYIIKNSEYSKEFLQKRWNMGEKLNLTHNFPAEQETLVYMYQNNIIDLKNNITVYPENTFNSSNPAHLLYKEGQFILHMMATDNSIREEYFKKYYEEIKIKYGYTI